jgi:hypothetical protein
VGFFPPNLRTHSAPPPVRKICLESTDVLTNAPTRQYADTFNPTPPAPPFPPCPPCDVFLPDVFLSLPTRIQIDVAELDSV